MSDFVSDALLDILELIARIDAQTSQTSKDQFLADADIQDATAYRLLAIGEACRGISDEVKVRHAHIPWRQIMGMRNLLAHEYFIRESDIIWETIKVGLPELAAACRSELPEAE